MDVQEAYQAYFPRIREKCRRMLGEAAEAEDVAQETFVRLWQTGPRGAEPRRVLAWVYRTSTRLAIDRLRRRGAAGEVRCEETLHAQPGGVVLERQVEERHALLRLAGRLPGEELEAVLLHRLDLLTQPEVAEVLQVSERTVRRLLTRFDARVGALKEDVA